MKKGNYGYMNQYKKKHFIAVLIYAILIVILLTVANVWKNELAHAIGYVLSIVLVLPAAKHAVELFVVFHYYSLDEQSVEDLDEHAKMLRNGLVLYDITLASEKDIMYVPYMLLFEGKIYALVLNLSARISLEKVRAYLHHILGAGGFGEPEISVIHNISEMNRILEELHDSGDDYDLAILEKMKEQILIYNV